MDTLTPQERSAQMRSVAGKNTRPELFVRSLLHRLGYRFKLHSAVLPGRPDVIFARRHKVIFVHGCFWHRHEEVGCRLTRTPKSNLDYWESKFAGNKARDQAVAQELATSGWEILVIWECQTRGGHVGGLEKLLLDFLGPVRSARVSSGIAAKSSKSR